MRRVRQVRAALELIKDEAGRQNRSLRSLAREAREGTKLPAATFELLVISERRASCRRPGGHAAPATSIAHFVWVTTWGPLAS